MSLGISTRLKYPKKHELIKSHSQSQILANKLRQDGVMGTVENVMQAVDQVAALLVSKHIDMSIPYKDSIINLCQHLKVYGAYLELLYEDQLNRAFVIFRNSSQDDERLDYLSRLHLLELIELRAKGWKGNDIMHQYYKKKVNHCVQIETSESTSNLTDSMTSLSSSAVPLLGPGEIIKPSGKFTRPTRIPGKNYCKDEVVIRNADSGKVNPGAKERLVQITGANEESINHAKQLIEDTIRRNASPVRDQSVAAGGPLTGSSSSINSSASEDSALPHSARASRTLLHSLSTNDANLGEFKYSVVVGGHTIKITGDNLDLVRTSKLVLDEYFSGEPIQDVGQFYNFDSLPQPIVTHDLSSPLSPPESLPSPGLSNGQTEEAPATAQLRRPHLAIEEIMKGKTSPDIAVTCHAYSIEYLARLAMSPLCLTRPEDWDRISTEYPTLIRKDGELFDAKQYLSNRSNDQCFNILSADEVEADEI